MAEVNKCYIKKSRVFVHHVSQSGHHLPPPPPAGFPSLVRSYDASGQARNKQRMSGESVRQSQRASVRQSEGNYHYRDISLRKFSNFTQIILSPSTTKMKNALNSRVSRSSHPHLSSPKILTSLLSIVFYSLIMFDYKIIM